MTAAASRGRLSIVVMDFPLGAESDVEIAERTILRRLSELALRDGEAPTLSRVRRTTSPWRSNPETYSAAWRRLKERGEIFGSVESRAQRWRTLDGSSST